MEIYISCSREMFVNDVDGFGKIMSKKYLWVDKQKNKL